MVSAYDAPKDQIQPRPPCQLPSAQQEVPLCYAEATERILQDKYRWLLLSVLVISTISISIIGIGFS